jgi:hypothetical protein
MEGQKINASNLVTTLPADALTPLSSVREVGDEEGSLSEIVDSSEHRLDRIG